MINVLINLALFITLGTLIGLLGRVNARPEPRHRAW